MATRGPNQERSNNRLARQILGHEAYGEKRMDAPGMADIAQLQAGQNGFRTDFEGYVNNSAYVRRNLIAVLVEAPRGFQHLPNPNQWVATLKSLIELHANSIEGLTSTLTVDFVENAVGGAGEMQEDISNVTRARSTPSFTWTEKYGKPINAFLEGWITNLMMDPITKVPNIMTRSGSKPTDILPDYTGCTILFLEPDPTHTRVVHAWLCTNMHPKTAGEVTGSRDLTAAGESVNYSVEFTSLTQEGLGVQLLAQRYLDEMNMSAVNPNLKPAFVDQIEQDIIAADSGYQDQLDRASSVSVQGGSDPNTPGHVANQYDSVAGDSSTDAKDPDMGHKGSTSYRTNGAY
tara:strand:- start:936 stop:1976 length:1041 start_codon:yes stop_codon:yes gene_type:complete